MMMTTLISRASSRHLCVGRQNLHWVAACCKPAVSPVFRMFSSSSSSDDKSSSAKDSERTATTPSLAATEWRKQQLDKIENKFKGKELKALSIESEEDLQPMWKEMEGRVTRRKPRSLADTGGKSGRMNIKKTDEDVWLEQGLYSTDNDDSSKKA